MRNTLRNRRPREPHDRPEPRRSTAPRLGDFVAEWIDQRERVGKIRPTTAAAYRRALRLYIAPTLGGIRLDLLTPADVERMADEVQARGCSPTTALQAHNIVKGALRAAERQEIVTRNVASIAEAPSRASFDGRALTADEVRAVLRTAREAGPMRRARAALALLAGLRQGEALGLTRECVDLERRVLRVEWQLQRLRTAPPLSLRARHVEGRFWLTPPKSRAGVRDVALAGPLLDALAARLATMPDDPRALVITNRHGGPLDPALDREAWAALLAAAGVPPVRLHDARHTAATLMMAAGLTTRERQDALGHAGEAVAEHYAHRLDADRAEAMARWLAQFDDDTDSQG